MSILAGSRILVVEDQPLIAECLAIDLEEAGAVVVGPVPSPEAALALLQRPDVAVDAASLDWNLGHDRDSAAVADHLAALGRPFVFFTGALTDALRQRYPEATVIAKPTPCVAVVKALAAQLAPSARHPIPRPGEGPSCGA